VQTHASALLLLCRSAAHLPQLLAAHARVQLQRQRGAHKLREDARVHAADADASCCCTAGSTTPWLGMRTSGLCWVRG
jgi:hypothetical protein